MAVTTLRPCLTKVSHNGSKDVTVSSCILFTSIFTLTHIMSHFSTCINFVFIRCIYEQDLLIFSDKQYITIFIKPS